MGGANLTLVTSLAGHASSEKTTTIHLPPGDTYAGHTDHNVCARQFLEDKYHETSSQTRLVTLYAENTIYHLERIQHLFEKSVPRARSRVTGWELRCWARYCVLVDLDASATIERVVSAQKLEANVDQDLWMDTAGSSQALHRESNGFASGSESMHPLQLDQLRACAKMLDNVAPGPR